MSKFDADAMFEQFEVVLGGKTYTLGTVTQGMLEQVDDVAQDPGDGTHVVDRQLGVLLDLDPKSVTELDIRSKAAAVRHLLNTITSQIRGEVAGNAPADSIGTV